MHIETAVLALILSGVGVTFAMMMYFLNRKKVQHDINQETERRNRELEGRMRALEDRLVRMETIWDVIQETVPKIKTRGGL